MFVVPIKPTDQSKATWLCCYQARIPGATELCEKLRLLGREWAGERAVLLSPVIRILDYSFAPPVQSHSLVLGISVNDHIYVVLDYRESRGEELLHPEIFTGYSQLVPRKVQ